MLSYGDAFYRLKNELLPMYDEQEAATIAHELLSHITGLRKIDRLMKKDDPLSAGQVEAYEKGRRELLKGRPLQYVTGVAWFYGQEYKVNEHVLIPRPETEELVDWIVKDHKGRNEISILDIGTGSGCIPISLKRAMPIAAVSACDISADALSIARENARRLEAEVSFVKTDFLNTKMWYNFGKYDVIVSNPPYIPRTEYENMHTNVRDHEPEIALFVPNDDALLFYRNIAEFAREHINEEGCIYCEVHKDHAEETERLFKVKGYRTALRADMNGNQRMLKAW